MFIKNLLPGSLRSNNYCTVHNNKRYSLPEFEELFSDLFGFNAQNAASNGFSPSLCIKQSDEEIQLRAELPGVKEEDIEIEISDNTLSIKGEKKEENHEENDQSHYSEIRYGSFCRRVSLPENIDSEKIGAKFENGMLTVSVPLEKTKEEKPRKIQINS